MDSYLGLMHTLFTLEEYDRWRYRYPEFNTTQRWGKVPSQELSNTLVDAFKDKLED